MIDDHHICLCGPSALEAYRAHMRLAPDLLDRPRTGKLARCGTPAPQMLEDTMERIGVTGKPYHLLIERNAPHTARIDVRRHQRTKRLPRRAIIKLSDDVHIVSPEMMFIDLAGSGEFHFTELVAIGYEICGTYLIDSSWDKMTNTERSLTSVKKIERLATGITGFAGAVRAREALRLIFDGSNSPMETALAMLMSFPRKDGGLGLTPLEMNKKVATEDGDKWVDIVLPGGTVGLEYKGRESHSVEQTERDDRRQNHLTASGLVTLNVWYEDIACDLMFDQLHRDIFNALGKRFRVAKPIAYRRLRESLRSRIVSSVKDYSGTVIR